MGNSNNKRSGRLAISPNINAGTNKKAKALQENKNTNHIRGVDGYSAKAIKLGIYEGIAYSIQMYREKNPDSTYISVYRDVLNKKYPSLFKTPPDKVYGGNISKFINSNDLWRKAYFASTPKLVSKALLKIDKMLDKDDLDDSVLVNTYDKLKKYEIAEKELQSNMDKSSDDDIPNFGYSADNAEEE